MFVALLTIAGLFLLGLLLKSFVSHACAICLAVSGTWLIGLVVGFEPLVLALLMGGTAVGLMYYLASVWPRQFEFFKLPILLTALTGFYFILKQGIWWPEMGVLVGVWIVFLVIYILRNNSTKNWFVKVVECCKNW